MSLFGAADSNNEKRRAEIDAYERAKEEWRAYERERKEQYDYTKDRYESDVKYQEETNRFREKEILESYNQAVARQDFEFDTAKRVYNQSVAQSFTQKNFNGMAEAAAIMEQNAKKRDDLLGVMFEEADTLLDYKYATTGLKVDKQNKLVNADFQEAKVNTKFTGDLGAYEIERRKARSESQIETQKAIIEGMKAAGSIRASGTAGRSSAKAVLGVMAESGALRSAIANGLMYAEQSVNLGIAQLKDMLILDQTMVLAARDMAKNEYDVQSSKLDASLAVDKVKISATKQSINERDAIVRKNIMNARKQADINAEAAVMLEPQRAPAITNPKEFYAEYDNPETEDYVELLLRPEVQEFPEYVPTEEPDYERDFHYQMGRTNVAASNFGDALKIGGMVASVAAGAGTLAAGGLFGGAASGSLLGSSGFLAKSIGTFGTISSSLTGLSSSFYPSYRR